MTPEQQQHLKMIIALVSNKYRSGAEAHKDSDPLMDMPALEQAENLLAEAVDKVAYAASLVHRLTWEREPDEVVFSEGNFCEPLGYVEATTGDDITLGQRRWLKGPYMRMFA